MDKKTPVKRKSLVKINSTPTKIQKINTPVSQKINKSPKSANKINQKQNNGNKFSKSPNKIQKTPQKKQMHEKQNTPNKGKKPRKVVEEAEESDEDEIDDESVEEITGNDDNSDALDSDNGEVQIDEDADSDEAQIDEDADSDEAQIDEDVDSDEEAEIAEENSDAEAEVAKEDDSDEEAEVANEADSDEESEVDEEHDEAEDDSDEDNEIADQTKNNDKNPKNKSQFTLFVKYGNLRIPDIFKDCNIVNFHLLRHKLTGKFTGTAYVHFADEISYKKALSKNGTKINNRYVLVKRPGPGNKKFEVYVQGLTANTNMEDIFTDSKIIFIDKGGLNNNNKGHAYIEFVDEESLKKALLKDGTKYNNSVIKMSIPGCRVFVKGLKLDSKIEDIFNDCNVVSYKMLPKKYTNEFTGFAIVNLKDHDSKQKALDKNGIEIDGQTLTVEPIKPKPEYNNKFKTTPGPFKSFGSSTKSWDNPHIMKKKLLLDELKSQAFKLEQEIYGSQKPFNKKFIGKKPFQRN